MPETVHILSESRVSLPGGAGVSQEVISLTYVAQGIGPRIVYIDPIHDSEEERKAKIAADLVKARATAVPTIDLP